MYVRHPRFRIDTISAFIIMPGSVIPGSVTLADPESFTRVGPTLDGFLFVQLIRHVRVGEYKSGPSSAYHLVIPRVAIRYLNPWPHNDTFFRLSTS